MISLKKREHISANPLEVDARVRLENPDASLSGVLLLAVFVLTFCCRYCQASLFASVQYNAPEHTWWAPDTALLLFPAAAAALAIGVKGARFAQTALIISLVTLSIGFATISLLLRTQIQTGLIVSIALALASVALEAGRISAWSQLKSQQPEQQTNFSITQMLLVELAATAFGISCFRQTAFYMPLAEVLRIASLMLAATFLLSQFLRAKDDRKQFFDHVLTPGENAVSSATFRQKINDSLRTLRSYPFGLIGMSGATSLIAMTLLCLTLANKVVANIPLVSLWSSVAIGLLFGSIYCLLPVSKSQSTKIWFALFLATVGCALCFYKPFGQSLFVGLFVIGFAATVMNFACFGEIINPTRSHVRFSSELAMGIQTALSCLACLAVALVIEPRIESLSGAVFVRLLCIFQMVFLTIAASFSYIIFKFQRSQG